MKNKAMFYKNVLKLIDNSFNYFFADKESTVCSFTTQYMQLYNRQQWAL